MSSEPAHPVLDFTFRLRRQRVSRATHTTAPFRTEADDRARHPVPVGVPFDCVEDVVLAGAPPQHLLAVPVNASPRSSPVIGIEQGSSSGVRSTVTWEGDIGPAGGARFADIPAKDRLVRVRALCGRPYLVAIVILCAD